MLRLARLAVIATALNAALGLSGLPGAGAAVPLSGVVSPAAVPWTPNVFAGTTDSSACQQWFGGQCKNTTVWSTAIVNGYVVVAGAFTQVCQAGPATSGHCQPGTTLTRDDIFAYQLGTGTIDPSFAPQFDRGPAYSVAAGPNGTVYIGGAFTAVNGETANRGVVQLSVTPGNAATDGQVVSAFKGHVSTTVYSVAYDSASNALYIGGQFANVDSASEDGIARLNGTTGAVDPSFGMSIGTTIYSGLALKVAALALSPDGSLLAIGGTFADVNGQFRPRLALIGTGGGLGKTASLANWAAPVFRNNCSAQHDYVRGLDISPDGSFLTVATTGYLSDRSTNPAPCDAVMRFETAAAGTNVAPTWVNHSGGDSFYSVAITGGVVYAGGHNRWVNNECGNNYACEANSVLVMGFAAMDANTGLALAWFHPMTLRGNGVVSLTAFPAGDFTGSNGGLLLGNNVTINGEGAFHSFEALFPLASATATPPTFGPVPSGIFLTGAYEFQTGVAAMCMDDTGDSTAPGNTVSISTCTNAPEQNWTVQANGNVTVNGLCLDTLGQGTTPGTRVDVNTCGSSSTQVWTHGPGNTLQNKAAGLCLDDPGSATAKGTVLDIATCAGGLNQVWPLPAAPPPASLTPAGPVSAAVPSSNAQPACLTDPGASTTSGTAAQMTTCEDTQSQQASIEPGGTIQIRGLCLDTQGQGTANGTAVVFSACNGSGTQVWSPGANNYLVNHGAGLCLNATSQSSGSGLTIASCSPSPDRQWWLPAV